MRRVFGPSAVVAVALMVTPSVFGQATVSYTFDVTPQTFISNEGGSPSLTLDLPGTLPMFDPALGTLQGFEVELDYDFSFRGTTGPAGGSMSGGMTTQLFLNSVFLTAGGNGSGNGGGPNSPLTANYDIFLTADDSAVPPTFLSGLVGTGDVDFVLETVPMFDFASLGTSTGEASLDSGTTTITYTFIPIPEPATLGLLAAGGFALLRRRRSAR